MSDLYDDWATVVPGQGLLKQTAQELLALADDPSHVRTTGNGTEFLVPQYLAELHVGAPAPANPFEDAPTAPPKRRPRAKKESDPS